MCVDMFYIGIPVLVRWKLHREKKREKKVFWMKSSVAVDIYRNCCCFLGNIPETEDENLPKPLKHTTNTTLHVINIISFFGEVAHTRLPSVSTHNDNHSLSRMEGKRWKIRVEIMCVRAKHRMTEIWKGTFLFSVCFCIRAHTHTTNGVCCVGVGVLAFLLRLIDSTK